MTIFLPASRLHSSLRLRARSAAAMGFLSALLAVSTAAVVGVAPAGAAMSTTPALSALVNPPFKAPDIFDLPDNQLDRTPAGLCTNWANVYDPAAQHSSGTWVSLALGYSSGWRENVLKLAAVTIALRHQHLAIWLYRWNGRAWAYTNRAVSRYPVATYPYFRRPAGDSTAANFPTFTVPDGTGYYTIPVGVVSAAGAVVDSSYVHSFGHPSLDGDSPTCGS
jgi:hypothetical protein